MRLIISLFVLALACAGVCASAAAQQPYPPPPPGYYPPPPGYYPPPPPPGYYPPGNYTPEPPQPYGDEPLPPGAVPRGYDRDVTGGPVQPYDPYRPGAGNPPPGYYPPPGASQRTTSIEGLPPDEQPDQGPRQQLAPQFQRQLVDYPTTEPAGTIIIDTPHTFLYLMLGNGKALRYGIGVGREGFTWAGTERISRMTEWPDWHPPKEMIERQPYLPRFMAGGETNPLGARALYLGNTLYRIHGTNQPSTIGHFVSSGCIRLTNEDVADLYSRVSLGTRVVVLPGADAPAAQRSVAR
ncbi:MAG TPA: L,D-transpeptidase family protein [Xanthobacteraceae bacterium]